MKYDYRVRYYAHEGDRWDREVYQIPTGDLIARCNGTAAAVLIVDALNEKHDKSSKDTGAKPKPRRWNITDFEKYDAGVTRIGEIVNAQTGSPESIELSQLSLALERFEVKHFPVYNSTEKSKS